MLDRIVEKIGHALGDEEAIALQLDTVLWRDKLESYSLGKNTGSLSLDGLADNGNDINLGFPLEARLAARPLIRKQLIGQPARVTGSIDQVSNTIVLVARSAGLVLERFGHRKKSGDRIAQLMGRVGDERVFRFDCVPQTLE